MTSIICLKCYTIAGPLCKCGNDGALRDIDDHINVYVEDITTCRRVRRYMHDGIEVYRELLSPYTDAVYVDYQKVRGTYIGFTPIPLRHVPQEANFNKRLRNFLRVYSKRSASEGRVGTTYQTHKRRIYER